MADRSKQYLTLSTIFWRFSWSKKSRFSSSASLVFSLSCSSSFFFLLTFLAYFFSSFIACCFNSSYNFYSCRIWINFYSNSAFFSWMLGIFANLRWPRIMMRRPSISISWRKCFLWSSDLKKYFRNIGYHTLVLRFLASKRRIVI